MIAFKLFPDSPFPMGAIKGYLGMNARHFDVKLTLRNSAEAGSCGYIELNVSTRQLYITYQSHADGGRERLQSDMISIKDLLIQAGGFHISECNVFFSNCCDDLIPNAVTMFHDASSVPCKTTSTLTLSEIGGALDPNVAANVVEKWRFGSSSLCQIYPRDALPTQVVLEAIFTNSNINRVRICPLDSRNSIGIATLGCLTRLLSSPSSSIVSLDLHSVSTSTESDRVLGSMIERNRAIEDLQVHFDSDCWVATEMSRAMRDTNCKLKYISISPPMRVCPHANDCLATIMLYAKLNRLGMGCMRSVVFRAEKIPILLEKARYAEGGSYGRYLYPLLRDNPSSWIGYLSRNR